MPRGEGTLAARPRKFRLSAGLVPGLFYGLYLLTVMGTQGLAWAADIALPAVLVAGADAVQTLEQKAQLLLAQADAYRELSSFLAHDDANA